MISVPDKKIHWRQISAKEMREIKNERERERSSITTVKIASDKSVDLLKPARA